MGRVEQACMCSCCKMSECVYANWILSLLQFFARFLVFSYFQTKLHFSVFGCFEYSLESLNHYQAIFSITIVRAADAYVL